MIDVDTGVIGCSGMGSESEQMMFGWAEPKGEAAPAPLPRAEGLRGAMETLARRGVYVGGSSWKYPGWLGQIYQPSAYQTRGKFSARKFNDECLGEYAQVFKTVCGDFAFYQFPTPAFWSELLARVPAGFRMGLKVPEDITMERFPQQARYGERAGTQNGHFMDAGLLRGELLDVLEPHRHKLGPLIFEFTAIWAGPYHKPEAFVARLDQFLSEVPTDRFDFAVEIRNAPFIDEPGYFETLREHRVAHCFNSWTRMPPVLEQLERPGCLTAPHVVGRFLLKPGRAYAEAVEQFSPYDQVRDPYPEGRTGLADMIRAAVPEKKTVYAFVNNRFEGNSLETIETTLRDHPDLLA